MPKKLATSQSKFKKDLEKLAEWAVRKGYTVTFAGNQVDEVRRIYKEINICTRTSLEIQLFGLAHECGHVIIQHNLKRFKSKYPRNYESGIEGKKIRQWSRVSLHQEIAEECEAWQKGAECLKRLNIDYDKDKFDKVAADCVFTYIKAAAEAYG